jgi:pyruvate formate lyase activating enzyme
LRSSATNKHPALFWSAEHGGAARCLLCPRGCVIPPGGAGRCGGRVNAGGELFAAGYGVVSSVALDPVEKKPLARFHPGKLILSAGGYGCNLSCPFCQNSSISARGPRAEDAPFLSPEGLTALALQYTGSGNIGLAYTYNEPLIAYEYVLDCAAAAREAGLLNVLVTNGYVNPEPLAKLLPLIDAMNIDLKCFSERFYQKLGGDLKTVTRTIETCARACHVEVTMLILPGENEEDAAPAAEWLASIDPGIPLHLSRFFPRHLYAHKSPTPPETILRLRDTASRHLRHVYAGNMP